MKGNQESTDKLRAYPDAVARLVEAIEIMDQKITPFGEREDGTTLNYIVADSTWHRVLAAAREPWWMPSGRSALTNTPGVAHGPGDVHRYRIQCEVCGQAGTVQLSIEPQAGLAPPDFGEQPARHQQHRQADELGHSTDGRAFHEAQCPKCGLMLAYLVRDQVECQPLGLAL